LRVASSILRPRCPRFWSFSGVGAPSVGLVPPFLLGGQKLNGLECSAKIEFGGPATLACPATETMRKTALGRWSKWPAPPAGIAQLVEQLICNWKWLICKALPSFAKW
jgi:hypothetical protein